MKLQHLALITAFVSAPAFANTDRDLTVKAIEATLSKIERDQNVSALSNEALSQSARQSAQLMKRAGFRVLRGGGSVRGSDRPQVSEVGHAILATNNPNAEMISLNYELVSTQGSDGKVRVLILEWRLERTSTIRPGPGATIHN